MSAYAMDSFPALDEPELRRAAESQYLARHPQEGKAPTPFGITFD